MRAYSRALLDCERSRQVPLSFWRAVQCWRSDNTITHYGGWSWRSVSLAEPGRFLFGCRRNQSMLGIQALPNFVLIPPLTAVDRNSPIAYSSKRSSSRVDSRSKSGPLLRAQNSVSVRHRTSPDRLIYPTSVTSRNSSARLRSYPPLLRHSVVHL
jgi:hypothetical protein